ncbi:UDP-glucuronosyltransferase 1A7 [Patella vulgata]|uniref:UDP-glucuronosyltransferase 1A7 n=1 Tax=Patella vulgata TaxID=6465 RepID=UPI00217F98AE|nr:UDP-glucuronosyltransferase 1A7 [Patella vulgata]XP_050408860.1 UDP-glucuronosyltransferase 1A7 [Patella vulgata]
MKCLCFLAFMVVLPSIVFTAKILFVCTPVYSHVQQMSFIADALIEKGHDVWITSLPDMDEKLNLKKRKIQITPFAQSQKINFLFDQLLGDSDSNPIFTYLRTGKRSLPLHEAKTVISVMITDDQLASTIKREKFDLMVVESVPVSSMLTIIPYKYDIPFVYFGPFCHHYQWRIPFSPSFVPFKLFPFSDRMTFTERVLNTLIVVGFMFYDPFNDRNTASIYAPERPFIGMTELQRRARLYIVEVNELLDYPYPVMPNVIKIGSLTPRVDTKMPEDYAKFLDRSQNGVVIVSFGSIFPNTNVSILSKLVTAFTNTKYDFIIKGSFAKSTDRMMVSKWIPQKTLLKHKKTRLFVTHCGTNGVGEGISNGVPMLGFPLFGDQPANGFLISSRGYGLQMDLFAAKTEDIKDNINEIIENPSYKSNINKASQIVQELEKRENPSEVAAFWIEHVIKFGGEYRRSSSIDMPLYQYLLLDVLALLILICTLVLTLLFCCLKTCYRMTCSGKPKIKSS